MPTLLMIRLDHGAQQLEVIPGVLGDTDERCGVLGETRPSIAGAGLKEVRTDAMVHPHARYHVDHICTHGFTHVGKRVDEGEAGGKIGIGCVLDHLG